MKSETKTFYRVDLWDRKGFEEEREKSVFRILLTEDDEVSFKMGEAKTIFIC